LSRVYVDTNVFVYAVGGESRFRAPCRTFLRAVASRRIVGETSAYAMQEVAHQRRRRGDASSASRAREVAAMCAAVHATDRDVVFGALELVERHTSLSVADAIHAATALRQGIGLVVSADSDFDGIPGIERLDPLDSSRIAALATD
jgi:predicted nucleic acid-binding protein